MAKLNTAPKPTEFTHEGGPAKRIDDMAALRRSVCSCLLWEDSFYESGEAIADRITGLAKKVDIRALGDLAYQVRKDYRLRHVPLLLLAVMAARKGPNPMPGTSWSNPGTSDVKMAISRTIGRVDEMGELLAIYAKVVGVEPDKIKPVLPAQMKKGLAAAFRKFDAYQLAKYNRKVTFSLKDIMRLTHPKPENDEQAKMWKDLLDGNLKTPDTWETNLSAGKDKKETFTRLLTEKKLGYLALLRNLRNMVDAGVETDLIVEAIIERRGSRNVLPFRYISAARAVPQLEPHIDLALRASIEESAPLDGKTIVLVDVSMSMFDRLSNKSDLKRIDAAAALASVINGDIRMFSFSSELVEVPPRRGMAGVDAIQNSQPNRNTMLGDALRKVQKHPHDRIIVVTDEQTQDRIPDPVAKRAYMINVASYANGVGYHRWTHIDGFSESVIRYIHELERVVDESDVTD